MRDARSDPDSLDASWSALMVAAQGGEKAAYGRLLRECTPLIRRVVRRGMRPDRIDDAVQDVLLTIHRARHTYDPRPAASRPGSPPSPTGARSTSSGIAGGTTGARSTRPSTTKPTRVTAPTTTATPPSNSAAGSSTRRYRACRRGQRQAIEVLALRQLSLDEAANVTGKTKGALKVNMHRALKSLRERFGGTA